MAGPRPWGRGAAVLAVIGVAAGAMAASPVRAAITKAKVKSDPPSLRHFLRHRHVTRCRDLNATQGQ